MGVVHGDPQLFSQRRSLTFAACSNPPFLPFLGRVQTELCRWQSGCRGNNGLNHYCRGGICGLNRYCRGSKLCVLALWLVVGLSQN